MGYFKAVRSGGEISMRIADLLETAAPKEYTGANRVKTILECNDVLQGRADNISIGMLEEFLEQKCGNGGFYLSKNAAYLALHNNWQADV